MSLLNDPDYLIHHLRIGYLRRVDDRIGGRIITFDPTTLSNDYIKAAGSSYPEMQECYSPSTNTLGNDYFSRSIGSSSHIGVSPGGVKIGGRRRAGSGQQAKFVKTREQLDLPQQNVAAPPVFVTSPPKPSNARREPAAAAAQSYSSGGALKTSPDSITALSSTDQTPQLSPTTSAESDPVMLIGRRESSGSLLHTNGTLPSTPPPRRALSEAEVREFIPDPPQPIVRPKPFSALSAMIEEKKNKEDNPFAENYSYYSGKGDLKPIKLQIYLPFSTEPKRPLNVVVKSDATVEKVIGYCLYQYWEEKRKPILEPQMCNISNWIMRIVEDDGEIDEDLLALDRTRNISKFQFNQFALCEANPEQGTSKSQVTNKDSLPSISTVATNGSSTITVPTTRASTNTETVTSFAPPIDLANQVFLRIRLTPYSEITHTTTINVPPDQHLSDVLEGVCRKRKLDSKEYTFKMAEENVFLELDKTVESVGNAEIALVKKPNERSNSVDSTSGNSVRGTKKGGKRGSMDPQPTYITSNDYTSVYQKYTVNRKTPMFVGRHHERILAIDGDYIHIMPSETRTMFDTMKTSSYHISNILSCKPTKKVSANFKLVINRDTGNKTYDFEAESAKVANEICTKIRWLMGIHKNEQAR
ncbi:10827_t:CDS:10, partial [Paraglomus occultum]